MALAVNTSANVDAWVSDGALTPRAIPFPFANAADLHVTVDRAPRTRGPHYRINGAFPDAQFVPLPGFALAGQRVVLRRRTAARQDYRITGPALNRDALEAVLDRAVMTAIDTLADVGRAILVPPGEAGVELPALPGRAGRLLGFDADGALALLLGTGADGALRGDLAGLIGAALVGYGGRSVADKLGEFVSVKDRRFAGGAKGDGVTDDTAAIQAALDALAGTGKQLLFPDGRYRTTATLLARTGVSLIGFGSNYRYDGGPIFEGAWIDYAGPATSPAMRFRSVQDINVHDIGFGAGERPGTILIEIGSDNAPSTKRLSFRKVNFFGADLAVRWGLANALTPLEQCDEIVFDEWATDSCRNGFQINATNAADFSAIRSGSLSNLTGIGFDLRTPGFMVIENVAAAFALAGGLMFKITGASADPLRITGCQSEGSGATFMQIGEPGTPLANDEMTILLEGNVINQPIVAYGICRISSTGNYVNTTVETSGFVRWQSRDDAWVGVLNEPGYYPQIRIGAGGQFRATTLKDARSFMGRHLPRGFTIENAGADIAAGGCLGQIVTEAGIVAVPFAAGAQLFAGQVVRPLTRNGLVYRVENDGVTGGAEPVWPTSSNGTVVSGGVTFREIGGPPAVLKRFGDIPATGEARFDPPNLAAAGVTGVVVPCPGAVPGAFVEAAFSAPRQGVNITSVECTAADAVDVAVRNDSGAPVDLAALTVRVRAVNA